MKDERSFRPRRVNTPASDWELGRVELPAVEAVQEWVPEQLVHTNHHTIRAMVNRKK